MKKFSDARSAGRRRIRAEGYKVINKIKIGGTGGWDYLAVDPATQRLYASHGGIVEVVDIKAGKVVGQITQLHGVHGIAVAPRVNKGFITNGQSNSVTIFDLKTLEKTGEPATGQNPDAICYEPKTQRIFTFNGRSNDSTAINAKNNEIVAHLPDRREAGELRGGRRRQDLRQHRELQRDRGDRCRQARRDPPRLAGALRRSVAAWPSTSRTRSCSPCAATR